MKRFFAIALIISVFLCGCSASAKVNLASDVDPRVRTYYEIFVSSFYDSDGDGIGDLKGIEEKLDYLNDNDYSSDSSLHVTGLWLMPIMPSPTYHKYDVTDYYDIDENYGTLEDFKSLSAACHERGINVIIDLVLNHTSSEHEWFKSACKSIRAGECENDGEECAFEEPCAKHNKYVRYYNFTTEKGGGFSPVNGTNGEWFYEARFWSGMPDLNLDNEDVRTEIKDIIAFWLNNGADGFRLDAVTSYYTGSTVRNTEFLSWLSGEVKAVKPDAYLVGEAWTDEGTILSLYESGVDSLFNFPFSQNDGDIISAVNGKSGHELSLNIEKWQGSLAFANANAVDAPFLTNHDNGRSAGALRRDLASEKLAAQIYLLLPGSPFIYYGEEIGMTGSGKDENKRTSFTWSLTNTEGAALSPAEADKVEAVATGAEEQLRDKGSLLRAYIDIIEVRNCIPALSLGEVTSVDTGLESVCAYTASYEGETVAVLHNLGDEEAVIESLFGEYKLFASLSSKSEKASFKGDSLKLPSGATAVLTFSE